MHGSAGFVRDGHSRGSLPNPSAPRTKSVSPSVHSQPQSLRFRLDELQERALQWRAQRLDVLVEVNGGNSALCDALGCELEFLQIVSIVSLVVIRAGLTLYTFL